jgi:hypothetical protein
VGEDGGKGGQRRRCNGLIHNTTPTSHDHISHTSTPTTSQPAKSDPVTSSHHRANAIAKKGLAATRTRGLSHVYLGTLSELSYVRNCWAGLNR